MAVALLANSLTTGGGLIVLILIFVPSGAPFQSGGHPGSGNPGYAALCEVPPYIVMHWLARLPGRGGDDVGGAAVFCGAENTHQRCAGGASLSRPLAC